LNTTVFFGLGIAIVLASATIVRMHFLHERRRALIDRYRWPPGLGKALESKFPDLSEEDRELIGKALRQFFRAYLKGGRGPIAMPSRGADVLWHEFILHTRAYREFCTQAFGRMLDHTPTDDTSGASNAVSLRRAWVLTCRDEEIDVQNPQRLPLLFDLDRRLSIADGYRYDVTPFDPKERRNWEATYAIGLGVCYVTIYPGPLPGSPDGGGGACAGGDSGGDGGCGGGCGGD
jgi:hypothetical protein